MADDMDDAWHSELAEERPALYHYLENVEAIHGQEHVLVPDLHGGAAAGDAARAEDDGQSVVALRRYGQPLSQSVEGLRHADDCG